MTRCDTTPIPGGPLSNSYAATLDDAEERLARGERHVYCGWCSKWVWPDKVHPEHRDNTETRAEFDAAVKKMEADMEAERTVADKAVAAYRKKRRRP